MASVLLHPAGLSYALRVVLSGWGKTQRTVEESRPQTNARAAVDRWGSHHSVLAVFWWEPRPRPPLHPPIYGPNEPTPAESGHRRDAGWWWMLPSKQTPCLLPLD